MYGNRVSKCLATVVLPAPLGALSTISCFFIPRSVLVRACVRVLLSCQQRGARCRGRLLSTQWCSLPCSSPAEENSAYVQPLSLHSCIRERTSCGCANERTLLRHQVFQKAEQFRVAGAARRSDCLPLTVGPVRATACAPAECVQPSGLRCR